MPFIQDVLRFGGHDQGVSRCISQMILSLKGKRLGFVGAISVDSAILNSLLFNQFDQFLFRAHACFPIDARRICLDGLR